MSKLPEHKSPSELSIESFVALVSADESLPQSLRNAVVDNKNKPTPEILAALEQAIGNGREA
jgi:hypothetical protein